MLLCHSNREILCARWEGWHAGFDPRFASRMRVIAELVGDLARDELCRPLGFQLTVQRLERGNEIDLPVAGRAIERPMMTLRKLGRHMARQGTEPRKREG